MPVLVDALHCHAQALMPATYDGKRRFEDDEIAAGLQQQPGHPRDETGTRSPGLVGHCGEEDRGHLFGSLVDPERLALAPEAGQLGRLTGRQAEAVAPGRCRPGSPSAGGTHWRRPDRGQPAG
jgi:hypothetical protein